MKHAFILGIVLAAGYAHAQVSRLFPTDYQFFTGGDGSLDANWSTTTIN